MDTVTGQQILYPFRRVADQEGVTILIAAHDLAVDAFASEVYHLQDGCITDERTAAALEGEKT